MPQFVSLVTLQCTSWFITNYLNANCAVKEHRCISNEVMYVKSLKKIRPDKILVDLYHAF